MTWSRSSPVLWLRSAPRGSNEPPYDPQFAGRSASCASHARPSATYSSFSLALPGRRRLSRWPRPPLSAGNPTYPSSTGSLPDELRRSYPLLLVGPRGWDENEILQAAEQRADSVRVTGFVPEDDLARLYAGCAVFCFPSLYEGFGLPVLEAMAAGAPVVTSKTSSLPEVGGDAVVYVQPEDERSIASAMERLLRSPEERARLGARARQRATEFSWGRVARAVLGELERAAATRKQSGR
jgi:Glycosyl transferases group 1